MLMAIAIGRLYQTVNSAISGMGAPTAVFRPIEANVTASGTASAIAYQIQLTREAASTAAGLRWAFFGVAAVYVVLTVMTVFVLRRLATSHEMPAPQEPDEPRPTEVGMT